MFRRLLIVSLFATLAGCSSIKPAEVITANGEIKDITEVSSEDFAVAPEDVVIEKPALNIPMPDKPEIVNGMELFVCERDGVKMLCTYTEMYRQHLNDLTNVLKYQKELQRTLETYKRYYDSDPSELNTTTE